MKNTFSLAIIALFFSAAVQAQEPVKTQPVEPAKTQPAVTGTVTTTATTSATTTQTTATPTSLVTLDSNLPDHLKGVTSSTVEPKHFLPVLGSYAAADGASTVTITVDEKNLGLVWVDGLPQGRFKALLKKSPATYKIPAQKTAEGKSVAEGTLIFDKDTKQLSINLGAAYNEETPAAVFTGKAKGKVWQFAKVDAAAQATTTTEQQ